MCRHRQADADKGWRAGVLEGRRRYSGVPVTLTPHSQGQLSLDGLDTGKDRSRHGPTSAGHLPRIVQLKRSTHVNLVELSRTEYIPN